MAEMIAEAWATHQRSRMQRAAQLAAEGREVIMVDESDDDWVW